MNAGVIGAVLAACAAVIAAVYTQIATTRRARQDRVYERQRLALIEVQDASLAVRDALRQYGHDVRSESVAVRPTPTDAPDPQGQVLAPKPRSDTVDRAEGRLDVCTVRVESPPGRPHDVVTALEAWRTSAREHFLSPNDTTAAAENSAWSRLHLQVAAALRR